MTVHTVGILCHLLCLALSGPSVQSSLRNALDVRSALTVGPVTTVPSSGPQEGTCIIAVTATENEERERG